MDTSTTIKTVRVIGTQIPSHLWGRPRAFWAAAMKPKQARNTYDLNDLVVDDAVVAELRFGAAVSVGTAA